MRGRGEVGSHFRMQRAGRGWQRLPGEAAECPCPGALKLRAVVPRPRCIGKVLPDQSSAAILGLSEDVAAPRSPGQDSPGCWALSGLRWALRSGEGLLLAGGARPRPAQPRQCGNCSSPKRSGLLVFGLGPSKQTPQSLCCSIPL